MAKKFKLNPISGEMELVDETSVLDLIDNDAPLDTTIITSFATLLSSAATEFKGGQVLFMLNMTAFSTLVGTELELAIQIDSGSDVVIGSHLFNVADSHTPVAWTLISTPSKGSHTINLRWRRISGTGVLTVDNGDRIQLKGIQF